MSHHAEIDGKTFRNALGAFATGVTIVTTVDESGHDIGLTVNSFNSVSLDPPLVLWSLSKTSYSLAAFLAATHFAVHILSAEQEGLSRRFAKRGADKFSGLALQRGAGGVPLIGDCSARFECRTAYRYDGGDHEIFVGEVLNFEHFDHTPMVFQSGRYAVALTTEQQEAADEEEEAGNAGFNRNSFSYLLGWAYAQLRRQLRPELERRGLSEAEYSTLALLTIQDGRRCAELQDLLGATAGMLDQPAIKGMRGKGLIQVADPISNNSVVSITDTGRILRMELAAVVKAQEENALEDIEYGEKQLLVQLLRRINRRMSHLREVPEPVPTGSPCADTP